MFLFGQVVYGDGVSVRRVLVSVDGLRGFTLGCFVAPCAKVLDG